jgi:hypothetical protein
LLRLSIALGAGAGFSIGLTLLWTMALGRAAAVPFTALAQIHGQIQAIGFVGLFVLGTAAQLLPGFLTRPLAHRRSLVAGGYLLAGSLLLRAIFQPLDGSLARGFALWCSGLGEIGGVGLCLLSYVDVLRHTVQPSELWRRVAVAGFGFLAVSVGVNLVAVMYLAAGQSVVPSGLDAALVHLELSGFAVGLILAVSRKILPRFLLLAPPRERAIQLGATGYFAGVALAAAGWLVDLLQPGNPVGGGIRLVGAWLELVGVVLYVVGLRLFRRPVRSSGAPQVTEPARRWIKIAFLWLLIASALAAGLAARDLAVGLPVGYFGATAIRHALAQGCLLTILVGLGARILPGFSGWAIRHPRYCELLIAGLTLGAILRVAGELANLVASPASLDLIAAGGTLGTFGFVGFAVVAVRSLGRLPGRVASS